MPGAARPTEKSPLLPQKPAGPAAAMCEGTTCGQTAFNMINCFIGAGILTVPFAFKLAGLLGGAVGLALVAGLNWLTSLLLGHALEKAAKLRPDLPRAELDLQALGAVAFGPIGQRLIAVLFALELWFALETFILLASININILTGVPRTPLIVVVGFLGTASLSLPMNVISAFSRLSVWCMLGGLAALVLCGRMTMSPATEHELLDVKAVPSAMGLFLYCFSGLPCLPNIRAAMREPAEYAGAVHRAFAFAVLYYGLVGGLGYFFFANATRESFTLNLVPAAGVPHHGLVSALALCSAALFAVKLQSGFPLYAAPVLQTLGFGGDTAKQTPQTIAAARFVFALASVAGAIFAQDALDGVAELMGAFLTMSTSVLFPVAAYASVRRLAGEPLGIVQASALAVVFLAGLVFGIVGTAKACNQLWTEERMAGHL